MIRCENVSLISPKTKKVYILHFLLNHPNKTNEMRFKTIEQRIKNTEGQFNAKCLQFKKAEVQMQKLSKCVVMAQSMMVLTVMNCDNKTFYLASEPANPIHANLFHDRS